MFFTVKSDITIHQNGSPQSPKHETEAEPDVVIAEPEPQPTPAERVSEITDTPTDQEPVKKHKEKPHGFGKLFKKKGAHKAESEKAEIREKENEISSEDQMDASQLLSDPPQVRARFLFILYSLQCILININMSF